MLWSVVLLAMLGAMLTIGGCAVAAVAAHAVPPSADAQYKGLAGQKVAVMVWTERTIRIDYPNLRIDTANLIQEDLIAKTDQAELEKAQFPWEARSVARFLKDHPELEGRAVTEFAHRISGITRLVYVEITDFSTRSETAVQLFKGGMTGNVTVLAVEPGKSSKIVYQKNGVHVDFPRHSPEGVLEATEPAIYSGTVKGFALEVAQMFYGHMVEED
jgi:hypothetical protein